MRRNRDTREINIVKFVGFIIVVAFVIFVVIYLDDIIKTITEMSNAISNSIKKD